MLDIQARLNSELSNGSFGIGIFKQIEKTATRNESAFILIGCKMVLMFLCCEFYKTP